MRRIFAVWMGAALAACGNTGGAGGTGSSGAGGDTSSSSATTVSGTGGATLCTPGKVEACPCPGGVGMGVQTCNAKGDGFGDCTGCSATTTGSSSSASTTGSSGSSGSSGSGGAPGDPCNGYPPAPYGLKEGDTIPNLQFNGFPDASKDTSAPQTIELCHFYNPTGAEMFPPGSQYGVGPKPRGLLLQACASWAGPCNFDAKMNLPARHSMYKPQGGEFLIVLEEGPVPGNPATMMNLVNWGTKYTTDYPIAIDPLQALVPSIMAYPAHFLVDLRTMKIFDIFVGVLDNAEWTKFSGLLVP